MNKTLIIECGFFGSNILTHLKTKDGLVIGTKFQKKNTSLDNFKAKKLLKTTFPSLKEEIAKVKQQIS